VPFVAVGLLLSYVVLRTGNLVVGLLVHALLNLATVCYLSGSIPRPVWALVVILALAGFARGAERAGRRLGLVGVAYPIPVAA
jgi:membrane protease YdiL (CAAX protease family)